MNILPPIPSEPQKRQAFMNVWMNEVRSFRKRPSFIIGMIMAAISSLSLIFLTDGIGRVAVLIGIFGVAAVYDTVVRHFCGVMSEQTSATATATAPESAR